MSMGWTTLSLAVRAATTDRREANRQKKKNVGEEEEEPQRDNAAVLEMIRRYDPDVEILTRSGLTALIIAAGKIF
jgi:hypothetical protein